MDIMKRIFTAWAREGEMFPHSLVCGEEPRHFMKGTVDPDCQILIWRIEACSWEEAMAIYNLRQGWAPYNPGTPAEPCPKCGALFYPLGSGQCWQCDHVQ